MSLACPLIENPGIFIAALIWLGGVSGVWILARYDRLGQAEDKE